MHLEIILWYSRPPRKSTLCKCCRLCRKNCSKRFKIRILQCLNTSVIHCRPHMIRKMESSADVFEFYDIAINYTFVLHGILCDTILHLTCKWRASLLETWFSSRSRCVLVVVCPRCVSSSDTSVRTSVCPLHFGPRSCVVWSSLGL